MIYGYNLAYRIFYNNVKDRVPKIIAYFFFNVYKNKKLIFSQLSVYVSNYCQWYSYSDTLRNNNFTRKINNCVEL